MKRLGHVNLPNIAWLMNKYDSDLHHIIRMENSVARPETVEKETGLVMCSAPLIIGTRHYLFPRGADLEAFLERYHGTVVLKPKEILELRRAIL